LSPRTYTLAIRNFQSIEAASLEVTGLTVIWGPHSSIGKSAVVRALDAMLFGNAPRGIVRNGAKACAVTLQWDDHSVQWVKGETVNGYVIDGVKYEKVGRAVPPVVKELGFYELEMQDITVKPQIRKQFDKAWPMVLSAADVGKVVGSLVQTEKVYSGIKNLLADSARVRSRRGQTETLILSKRKELASFASLDDLARTVAAIDPAPVMAAQDKLHKVTTLLEYKEGFTRELARLAAPRRPLPKSGDVARALSSRGLLEVVSGARKKISGSRTALSPTLPSHAQLGAFLAARGAIGAFLVGTPVASLEGVLPSFEAYQDLARFRSAADRFARAAATLRAGDAELAEYKAKLEQDGFVVCPECDGQGLTHA
jgi:hypothetical protein